MTAIMEEAPVFDTAEERQTDAQGEVFDPELHAAKPDGTPALKTDGTFRKKRRDAGRRGRTPRPAAARSKPTSGADGMPRALKEQHARHVRAIKETGGVLLTAVSFLSPIDAYTLSDLVDPFADALATQAQDTPQLAATLDKLGGAGGWAAVIAIVGLGTVQVMHNHDRIPEHVVRMVGGKPKREVEQLLQQRADAMVAAQQAGVADA